MPELASNWNTVRALLREDRSRLDAVFAESGSAATRGGMFDPSFVCVVLYRVSHHLFRRGHTLAARLVAQTNELLTGADISPVSEVGGGFVILSTPGTAIYGKAGRNLTVMPCSGIGGEIGRREDVGAGPGLPVIGDDVTLEPHCGILGPVRVGSRVRVGAAVMLSRDTPDDTLVEGPRPRLVSTKRTADA